MVDSLMHRLYDLSNEQHGILAVIFDSEKKFRKHTNPIIEE